MYYQKQQKSEHHFVAMETHLFSYASIVVFQNIARGIIAHTRLATPDWCMPLCHADTLLWRTLAVMLGGEARLPLSAVLSRREVSAMCDMPQSIAVISMYSLSC